jgi:hypothetical protein
LGVAWLNRAGERMRASMTDNTDQTTSATTDFVSAFPPRHRPHQHRTLSRAALANMQGDNLQDTTQIVSHEIVEGISAELGVGEIADDCDSVIGMVNGVMVQGYKSREDGDRCIIPGQLSVVVHPGFVFHPVIVNG